MLTVATILLLAVLIGAVLQRVTGMGLGLVAGPVLTVLLGPAAGVTTVNGLSIINAANNAWSVRNKTDWKRFSILAGGLVLGSVPAVFIIMWIDTAWLLIAIGALVLLSLAASIFKPDSANISETAKLPMIIAGAVAGFMSTVAGIAAPALTVYSRLTGWDYRDWVATLHPIIMVANIVSFVLKIVLLGGLEFGGLPLWIWMAAIVAIFVGAWFGDRLNDKLSSEGARKLAMGLAGAGAIMVLINGVMALS